MNVYLDAVFHPAITKETFMQEGWHYELEDPDGPVSYKGVVFNEMKGVFSSPESVYSTAIWRIPYFRKPPTVTSLAAIRWLFPS
jgi:Zn-dependent M16 (insulinase) family peptidase